jgi:hypothetical protein
MIASGGAKKLFFPFTGARVSYCPSIGKTPEKLNPSF